MRAGASLGHPIKGPRPNAKRALLKDVPCEMTRSLPRLMKSGAGFARLYAEQNRRRLKSGVSLSQGQPGRQTRAAFSETSNDDASKVGRVFGVEGYRGMPPTGWPLSLLPRTDATSLPFASK